MKSGCENWQKENNNQNGSVVEWGEKPHKEMGLNYMGKKRRERKNKIMLKRKKYLNSIIFP